MHLFSPILIDAHVVNTHVQILRYEPQLLVDIVGMYFKSFSLIHHIW